MVAVPATLVADTTAGRCRLLTFDAPAFPGFLPGQYLLLHPPAVRSTRRLGVDDAGGIPFSIASLPAQQPLLHVHFVPQPGSTDAARVLRFLAQHGPRRCTLSGPLGRCTLADDDHAWPLLFVAAGSGIAQCQAMLRALPPRALPTWLYWGVREAADLYCVDALDALARTTPRLRCEYVVSDDDGYRGRRGLVADAIAADATAGGFGPHGHLGGVRAVISGSPQAVQAIVARLALAGLRCVHVRSDMLPA
jgi:NAD(P)H-flavin reductase